MPKKKKTQNLHVQPVFKIFCEGQKTEPYYINGYIDYYHPGKRGIIVVEDTAKNTPVQLVDIAVQAKAEGQGDDVIWVVFDRESREKYPDKLHAKARKKAEDNGIEIGFSNVCFEYWILLHFTYSTACYESCSELQRQSELKTHLNQHGIEKYEKGHPSLFEKIKDKVPQAIKNAEKLKINMEAEADPSRSKPYHINPYVDVHEMFKDIEKFINNEKSVRKESS